MAKVIGLSGPQGGGKTTLLNGLKTKEIFVDDFKVSRAVQAELGWASLENVLNDVNTMMQFQEKIRDTKYQREKLNQAREDVPFILTERTFADIAAYTQLWAWELADSGKWSVSDAMAFTMPFVETCAQYQSVYAANILLPAMPHILWQVDPHRARREHQAYISEQLLAFFVRKHPKNIPILTVTEGSVEGRIQQAYDWIQTL